MSIQGSGHYGVNTLTQINFFNSVLNFTLVVACCRPDGNISHILIPLIIGLFSIPLLGAKMYGTEHSISITLYFQESEAATACYEKICLSQKIFS